MPFRPGKPEVLAQSIVLHWDAAPGQPEVTLKTRAATELLGELFGSVRVHSGCTRSQMVFLVNGLHQYFGFSGFWRCLEACSVDWKASARHNEVR